MNTDIIKDFVFSLSLFLSSLLPQNTFVEGVVGQPINLNPLNSNASEIEKTIINLTYRKLFTYDIDGNLMPDLVDDWEISEDGLSYTLIIKKGQKFHDGREITSNDVLYTASNINSLKEIAFDKVGPYSIRFFLPNKFSPFLSILEIPVVSFRIGDKYKEGGHLGSGDFKITRIKKSGEIFKEIVLETTNKSYKIKRIIFKFYEDEKDLTIAAKLGEIDGFSYTNGDFEHGNFEKFEGIISGRYFGLFFNTKDENLSDSNIRRKLAFETPVDNIIQNVLGAKVEKTLGPLSKTWAQKTDLENLDANNDMEIKEPLKITLTIPDSEEHKLAADVIMDSWNNIGVETKIRSETLKEIRENIIPNRDFQVLLLGQEVPRDPDRYVLWHSTQVNPPGLNLTSFESIRVDKALEEGRKELNREERIKHYDLLQRLIIQESPAVFLYHPNYTYYINKNYKGMDIKKIYLPFERFWNLKNWTN